MPAGCLSRQLRVRTNRGQKNSVTPNVRPALRPPPLSKSASTLAIRIFGIYSSNPHILRCDMADALRITIEELRSRMEAGEDFTIIDVRNPQAWAQSDVMLPEAIRVPVEELEESLPKITSGKPIITYCPCRT